MALWKCQQAISETVWARGFLETWSADKGLWVDYLIKLKKKKKNLLIFLALGPFENLGILNLSGIYLKNYLS